MSKLLFLLFAYAVFFLGAATLSAGPLEEIKAEALKEFEVLRKEIDTLKGLFQKSKVKESELRALLENMKSESAKDIEKLKKSLENQEKITMKLREQLEKSNQELKELKNSLGYSWILPAVLSVISGILAGIAIDRLFLRG